MTQANQQPPEPLGKVISYAPVTARGRRFTAPGRTIAAVAICLCPPVTRAMISGSNGPKLLLLIGLAATAVIWMGIVAETVWFALRRKLPWPEMLVTVTALTVYVALLLTWT